MTGVLAISGRGSWRQREGEGGNSPKAILLYAYEGGTTATCAEVTCTQSRVDAAGSRVLQTAFITIEDTPR